MPWWRRTVSCPMISRLFKRFAVLVQNTGPPATHIFLVMLEQYSRDQVERGSHEDFLLLAADGLAVQMLGIEGVQFTEQLYTMS